MLLSSDMSPQEGVHQRKQRKEVLEAEGVRQMEELRELKRIETELKQQVMEKDFFDALKDYF